MTATRRTGSAVVGAILAVILAVLMSVGLVAGPAAASGIAPAAVPEPAVCVDIPDVLGAATCSAITTRLEADERSTGDELAVLVIRSTGQEKIEEYALRAFNTWGVGKSGEDNGILLVVALDDRTVRIQVGAGLEKTMTDGGAREIIGAELVPMFRAGEYRQGILNGLDAIRTRLGHEVTTTTSLAAIPQDPGYRPPATSRAPRTSIDYGYAYGSDRDEEEADDSSADTQLVVWIVVLLALIAINWVWSAVRGPGADGAGGSGYQHRSSWGSSTRSFSSRSSSSRASSGSSSRRSSFGGGRSSGGGGSGKW